MSRTIRLGAFIVAALLILTGAIFLIGDKQFLFRSTYRLNAQFPNVAGLGDGAEVRVGGIRKGTVKYIQLPNHPDGKVTVAMDLERATSRVIKKDSVASIAAEGLVGDKYVEISFGSPQAESVRNGDTIQSQPPLEMADLLKKTNQILDSAQGAVQNVGQTAGNLKNISDKINQGSGTVGALVNDKSVYQHVNTAATELQEDMEALKHNFLVRGFFHKRGYEDAATVKAHEIPQLPPGQYSKRFAYDPARIFDKPDTAKLKGQKNLNDAGKYLEQTKFGVAVVAVSAGMKGDTQKDRELTAARAMVVRDYLVQNFKIDDTRVKTMGLGKTKNPAGDGGVEILIYPASGAAARPSS